MTIVQIVCTVIVAVLLAAQIIIDISWLVSISRAKERAVIGTLSHLWLDIILLGIQIANLIISDNKLIWILVTLYLVLAIPGRFINVLSPEGVRTFIIFNNKGGIIPVDDYSYQYVHSGSGKENLELHRKKSGRVETYTLGIKNIKVIQMLADYYGKYGYENPLLKQDTE